MKMSLHKEKDEFIAQEKKSEKSMIKLSQRQT